MKDMLSNISNKQFKYLRKDQSVQFSSVSQSCPTLCDPMARGPGWPGLPVHHQLPEFTQTHIHQVSDAIQSSHPLSSAVVKSKLLRDREYYF